MNPRTVHDFHPCFSAISANVAPFFRWSMAITWAFLLPSRGPALSSVLAAFLGLGAFLAAVVFLAVAVAVALGLLPLALFWPLGAPFFGLAPFFEEAFSGATCAPCSATAAVFGGFCVLGGHFRSISFCGNHRVHHIDHSEVLGKQGNSAVHRRWRRGGDGVTGGPQMASGGVR